MNEMMSLIAIKETKQVLGALTCNAKVELTPELVVGSGLLMRGMLEGSTPTIRPEQYLVPAEELEIVNIKLDQLVLLRPRDYFVEEVDGVKEVNRTNGNPPDVDLSRGEVTIGAGSAVAKDTEVWVQIEGGTLTAPRIYGDRIKKTETDVTIRLDMMLDPGTYVVVGSLPGRPPRFVTEIL
jgi:hypothetical protein